MRNRIALALAALFGCITWKEHDLRISALLQANNREVARRRDAEDAVLIYSNYCREIIEMHRAGLDHKIPTLLSELAESMRPMAYGEDTH